MNPLSFNFYICPETVSLETFLPMAAAAGASAVGLTVRAINERAVADIRRELKANGLEVSSLNSCGFVLYGDAARAREQDALNARLIAAAAELEARTLMVITGGLAHGEWRMDSARARIAEALDKLARDAARAGVQLTLEPIHPLGVLEKACINTIRQGLALARSRANVGVCLDFFHSWWDPDFLDFNGEEKLRLVQICNVAAPDHPEQFVRDTLEEGFIDIADALRRLVACGYRGPFEFEMFPPHLRGRQAAEVIAAVGRQYAALARTLEDEHS